MSALLNARQTTKVAALKADAIEQGHAVTLTDLIPYCDGESYTVAVRVGEATLTVDPRGRVGYGD